MVLQEEQLAAPESEDADDSDSDKLRIAQSIEPAPDSSSQFIRSQDDTSNESSAEKWDCLDNENHNAPTSVNEEF